jgi:hypothetical protein
MHPKKEPCVVRSVSETLVPRSRDQPPLFVVSLFSRVATTPLAAKFLNSIPTLGSWAEPIQPSLVFQTLHSAFLIARPPIAGVAAGPANLACLSGMSSTSYGVASASDPGPMTEIILDRAHRDICKGQVYKVVGGAHYSLPRSDSP